MNDTAGYKARPNVAESHKAVRILPKDGESPFSICLIIPRDPTEHSAKRVLRSSFGLVVHPGCIVDRAERIQQWVEVGIQSVNGLAEGVSSDLNDALTNIVMDRRFRDDFDRAREAAPESVIETGFESEHPPPLFFDAEKGKALDLTPDDDGGQWMLCRDDALLAGAELPPYGRSLHRYLYVPQKGEDSAFIPVTDGAPENDRTRAMEEIMPDYGESVIPINPEGGLMMVRNMCDYGYGSYLEALGGRKGQNAEEMGAQFTSDPTSAEAMSEGGLVLRRHGRVARLSETVHLKLLVLSQAVAAVRETVKGSGRPLLNLRGSSLRVDLPDRSPHLPVTWLPEVELVDCGSAVQLDIPEVNDRYFVRKGDSGASVYWPEVTQKMISGSGTLRIRQVTGEDGVTRVEGTFAAPDIVKVSETDLLWMRLDAGGQSLDLYGHPRAQEALARGEVRFRSLDHQFCDESVSALKQQEGVPREGVFFRFMPVLSSPCDLYSLGVIAVQSLLVDKQNSLPIALDEVFALAHEVEARHAEDYPLVDRIRAIWQEEERWEEALGAHRLGWEDVGESVAAAAVPREVWWRILAAIVRMFPGSCPESVCEDYTDAPAEGLYRVFDSSLEEWRDLVGMTRSLVVNDRELNSQVQHVIGRLLEQIE